jgi:hypothetical protein
VMERGTVVDELGPDDLREEEAVADFLAV